MAYRVQWYAISIFVIYSNNNFLASINKLLSTDKISLKLYGYSTIKMFFKLLEDSLTIFINFATVA